MHISISLSPTLLLQQGFKLDTSKDWFHRQMSFHHTLW
jgi:hypothetical protein